MRHPRRDVGIALGIVVAIAAVVALDDVIQTTSGAVFTGTIPVGHTPMGLVIAGSSGYAFVANAGDDSVSILDLTRGTGLSTTEVGGTPGAMAVAGRAQRLFVVTAPSVGPEHVAVLDSQTGALVRTIAIGQTAGRGGGAIAVDDRRGRVIVTDPDAGTVSVLDAHSGALVRTIPAGLDPVSVTIDPHTGQAYVADAGRGVVLALDVARGRIARRFPTGLGHEAVQINPAGTRVFVASFDTNSAVGSGAEYDARSGRPFMATKATSSVVVVDPHTGVLYTVDFVTDSVLVNDRPASAARRVVQWGGWLGRSGDSPALGAWPHVVTMDARTGRLFVLMDACGQRLTPTTNGCVRVIDPRAGRLVATIPVGRGPSALAIDPPMGCLVVVNSRGGAGREPGALPAWLQKHLPWLPTFGAAGTQAGATTGTVSVLDAPS